MGHMPNRQHGRTFYNEFVMVGCDCQEFNSLQRVQCGLNMVGKRDSRLQKII